MADNRIAWTEARVRPLYGIHGGRTAQVTADFDAKELSFGTLRVPLQPAPISRKSIGIVAPVSVCSSMSRGTRTRVLSHSDTLITTPDGVSIDRAQKPPVQSGADDSSAPITDL